MQLFTLKIGASRLRSLVPAAFAALLATLVPHYARGAEIVHVVAKGQTLGRIAKRYHTTVDAIREVNNLKRGERLHPGLSLVIPEKGKEAEAARKAAQIQAKNGDGKKAKGKDEGKSKKGGKGKDGDDDGAGTYVRRPKKPGFIHLVRGTEKLETQLLGRHGKLSPPALAGLGKILHAPSGEKVPIDPRLATLIGMVSDHFGGRTIRVVSGYRPYTPAQYTPHSNHNVGRAMDFAVEGVPNTVVRDFCRSFRNAGVGYYPNSTFVHLDVRSGKSYWVDYSRPGEAPRYEGSHPPADADEAAGDVEPHGGASEAGTPGADADPGSN